MSIVTEDLQFSLSSIGFTLLSEIVQSVDCLMWCDLCASAWGVEKDPICWPTTKVSPWQIPLHVHTSKWVHKSWIILELAYINQISWVDHFCFFLWRFGLYRQVLLFKIVFPQSLMHRYILQTWEFLNFSWWIKTRPVPIQIYAQFLGSLLYSWTLEKLQKKHAVFSLLWYKFLFSKFLSTLVISLLVGT